MKKSKKARVRNNRREKKEAAQKKRKKKPHDKDKKRLWFAERKAARKKAQLLSGHESNYSRKASYLRRNGGMGIDYPGKPWKSAN